MSFEVFPTYPPSEFTYDTEPRILRTDFGDGYSQRAGDGMNCMPMVYNLKWNNLVIASINAMDTFLRTRGGYEAFYWTVPGGVSALKWLCSKWTVETYVTGDYGSLSATFVQVFDI